MAGKTKMNFEGAISELERAVSRLESGELTLDESLAEFERAVGLLRFCEGRLAEAKQKVRILIESGDGTVTDSAFDGVGDDEA